MLKRYKELIQEVQIRKPKSIMEIGTHIANNAIPMIQMAKIFNPDVEYWGFDLFDDMTPELAKKEFHAKVLPTRELAESRIKPTGINYHLISGNTNQTLPEFYATYPDFKTDFIFIDGGHSLDTIANDWYYCSKFMDKNSVVMFDDYYIEREDVGCRELITNLQNDSKYNVLFSNAVDKPEQVSIKLAKVRLK